MWERFTIKVIGAVLWLAIMLVNGFCEFMCWLSGEGGDDRDYDALDAGADRGGEPVGDSRDQGGDGV